jgi:hypothetical protein
LAKAVFAALFVLFALISVSQTLHMREVRYYSLALLLSSVIIGLYIRFRFYRPFNKIAFILLQTAALWLSFVTWSPLFIVALFSMGMSELCIFVGRYKKTNFAGALRNAWPALVLAVVAILGVIPMMVEFKYFEISSAIAELTGFDSKMFWANVSIFFEHFKKQELLLTAIAMKIFVACRIKNVYARNPVLFKVSAFLTLYFLASCFIIARIPQGLSVRYLTFLHPVLSVIIIFDLFMVLYNARNKQQNKQQSARKAKAVAVSERPVTSRIAFPLTVFALLSAYTFFNNLHQLKGHVYEMFHQYKGPLDYTIPYIKKNFPCTDTLVIAANYEEYSYMYYLNSKVIVGYVGNNLEEDARLVPDIIAYRKLWPHFVDLFNHFLSRARYEPVSFPVFDSPVNNMPNFDNEQFPLLNHRFKTFLTDDPQQATYLYIKRETH